MKVFRILALLSVITSLGLLISPASASSIDPTKPAPSINIFWESNQAVKSMTWIHRSVKVQKSAQYTYFSLIGNWTPPFYMGIQQAEQLPNGKSRKIAIFSAWDVSKDNNCTTCDGQKKPSWGAVEVRRSGVGVDASRFGFEGTGAKAILENFDWKIGDVVEAVAHLEVVTGGTEISAAIKAGTGSWKFLATYFLPQNFTTFEPGYSFVEDWVGFPTLERSATYFDSWLENDAGDTKIWLSDATVMPNESNKNVDFHQVKASPEGITLGSGGPVLYSTTRSYSLKSNLDSGRTIPVLAKLAISNPEKPATPLNLTSKQISKRFTTFKDCKAMRAYFPYGVAATTTASVRAAKGNIAPPVLLSVYSRNKKLDVDFDKVVCE